MTQAAISEKEQSKLDAKLKADADAAEEKKLNEGRTGKGTRKTIGYTRGRSTQRVIYEAFDEEQKETLPSNLEEAFALTKPFGGDVEANLVAWLIDGFNSAQYAIASDATAEFVNPVWPSEVQKQFKMAVKNLSGAMQISIEDAVNLVKPGIDKVHGKVPVTA